MSFRGGNTYQLWNFLFLAPPWKYLGTPEKINMYLMATWTELTVLHRNKREWNITHPGYAENTSQHKQRYVMYEFPFILVRKENQSYKLKMCCLWCIWLNLKMTLMNQAFSRYPSLDIYNSEFKTHTKLLECTQTPCLVAWTLTARRRKTEQKKKWNEKLRPRPGAWERWAWVLVSSQGFYSCETGATIGFQSSFSTPPPFPVSEEADHNLGTSTSFLLKKLAHPARVKLDCLLSSHLGAQGFLTSSR